MSVPASVRKSHLDRSRAASLAFVVASSAIAVAGLFLVAWIAGFDHVAARMRAIEPVWFATAFVAQIIAYGGYVLAYREVARVEDGCDMSPRDALAAVTAGFGAFVARGGFAVDVHAFKQQGLSDHEVRVRVMGLGALEYALLAPAACIVAIDLLADGHAPSLALTLPWAICVPLGFIAALAVVERREALRVHPGRRRHLAQMLDSIYVLKRMFLQRRHLLGPLGTAVYWFGDILCLWACLQAFTHGTPDIALVLLGYATGYALTRRTLPLGGAGAVDVLLPLALSWCGISLAAAVLAVFAYRVFNLWLPLVPAALGLRSLRAASH
ncbi:MAG TPA: lysylphosphatidylglycerol synthase domain-containing protein [Gaiellaceae bacterium]|nr:lysylphosphatidylglycerol synthase domain-containing protein [Gaiellaceae bacterium]